MQLHEMSPVLSLLSDLAGAERDQTTVSMLKFARTLDNPLLLEFFDKLSRDRTALEWVAHHSFSHANGFDKFVLAKSRDGGEVLRLHIWWPNPQVTVRSDQNIHNHRWDFESRIIVGEILQEQFARVERGERFYHYHYLPHADNDNYTFDYVGPAYLGCTSACKLGAGHNYFVSSDILHRVTVFGGMSATLVTTDPAKKDKTDVYSTREFGPSTTFPIEKLDVEGLINKLQALIHSIY